MQEALQSFERALIIFRAIGDRQNEIEILNGIGLVYLDLKEYPKSIEFYQESLKIARELGDLTLEVFTLKYIGKVYQVSGKLVTAWEYYQQVLQITGGILPMHDVDYLDFLNDVLYILLDLGFLYDSLEEYSKATYFFHQAIPVYEALIQEARFLSPEGFEVASVRLIDLYNYINNFYIQAKNYTGDIDYNRAIDFLESSLNNLERVPSSQRQTLQMQSLLGLGLVYIALEEYTKAIDYLQQGLVIYREEGNLQGELEFLSVLGSVRVLLGDGTGLSDLQQSLAMARTIGDESNGTQILNDIGLAYKNLGELEKAIDAFQEALELYTQMGKLMGQAEVINNLGVTYTSLGQYSRALDFFQKAREIFEENNSNYGLAKILNNVGFLYRELGQFNQSREFYGRALLIHQNMENRGGEAATLHNIGLAYNDEQKYEIALTFYQKALDIWRNTGNMGGQATVLNNIGLVQSELGQFEFALQSVEEAISIVRSLKNRVKEGNILDSLGTVYRQAKQYDLALAAYEQALTVLRSTENRSTEQVTLSNIAKLFEEQGNSELAIVFYKQSVNLIEDIRQYLRTLPREQQQSYTETVADTYRDLANLLLKNDRILEAQRVLDLLKVQELDDYLHNVRGNDNTTQGLPNLPAKRDAWERYEQILDEAVEIGKELAQLQQKETLTPAEDRRLTELSNAQEILREAFNNFTRIPEVLALVTQRSPEILSQDLLLRMGDFNGLQDNLRNLEQNAVLLYPLILDDRLELILTTGNSPPIRRTVPVSKSELNAAIVAFRSALQTPGSDAKTPAQQLYNWLIQPLENDLKAANAETIIYAPDGQLRYIPLAALHDGENWLIQRYRINNITAASLTDLDTQPQPQLNVLAGAFANGYYSFTVGEETYNFAGLPFAGVEVETLAQTVPATTPLLDTNFTPAVVPQFNRYNTVHLATHGAFVVGTPDDSFILFGNGERATLRDIAAWGLTNVDLVVLSACETGLGGNLGNGEEILGLGYQIQQAGARAAIASLWIVDDGGTQLLMNGFYAALQREMTKAEALRQAQIARITGDYTAVGGERGAIEIVPILDRLPRQVASGLSHPYYWAPFILIGNGL